ncbi:uncharacterized protein LOC142557220 [Dermacentor variabilis]|uniref:uncharacterized protein LOC142557220 n=1 Tax=Dermacentor variabilis TaxID=34621 RepID=UPI003F5B80B0
MNPTTIALSVLVLAAVCLADSERRRDRTDCSSSGCSEKESDLSAGEQAWLSDRRQDQADCSSSGCAEKKNELSAGEKAWLSERRLDQADCSSSGCAEEKRELSDGEQGLNVPDREQSTTHRIPAAPGQTHSPAHDSHQQDSSSPLLKVNFWLTLFISALVAALLS